MTMRYSAQSTMIDVRINGLKCTVLNCVCNREGGLYKYLYFMFNTVRKKRKNVKHLKKKKP